MTDEDDLRRRFAALRDFDEERTPSFEAIRDRCAQDRAEQGGSWFVGWRVPGLALAGVAAVLIWLSGAQEQASEKTTQWVAGQWVMPTDVLLDLSTIPGDNLLYEVPRFDIPVIEALEGAHITSTHRRIRV